MDLPERRLPSEVLEHIFRFLPLSDLVWGCSLVSPRWLHAAQAVANDTRKSAVSPRVVFRGDDEFVRGFKAFRNGAQITGYSRFAFENVCVLTYSPSAWDPLLASVTSLSLASCNISEKDLSSVLLQCASLKSLHLIDAREYFISGKFLDDVQLRRELANVLVKVEHLDLSNNSHLTDALFNRLVSCVQSLSSVQLDNCKLLNHAGHYKKFYPDDPNADSEGSPSIFTFRNFLRFVSQRSSKLKQLSLYNCALDGIAVQDLVSVEGLRLDALEVGKCTSVTQEAILTLATKQTSLTSLGLDYCRRVFVDYPATSLQILQELGPRLRRLSLRGLSIPTGSDALLANLDVIEELDLTELDAPSRLLAEGLISSKAKSSLKRLKLISFASNPEALERLFQHLPNLQELDLSNCQEGATDRVLQSVLRNVRHLRRLTLKECRRLTDAAFTGLGEASLNDGVDVVAEAKSEGKFFLGSRGEAEVLNHVRSQQHLEELADEGLNPDSPRLDMLHSLRCLDLTSCKISDLSLRLVFRFRDLRHVNLTLCHSVSDAGFVLLGESNPGLESVVAKQCRLSDEGLAGLTRHTPRLRRLDVEGCKGVTAVGLRHLSKHCPRLVHLDVSFCVSLKEADVLALKQAMAYLRPPLMRGIFINECLEDFN